MKLVFKKAGLLLASAMLVGCSTSSIEDHILRAKQLAAQGNLTELNVDTQLPIKVWGRLASNTVTHVYIEGDGHAWRTSHQPSLDPTPHNPVALKLAAADPHTSVLYLGRPCQYLVDTARGCHFSVWTKRRFGEVADIKTALLQLAGDNEIVLIGFSGGANLAIQLAAQLPQVSGLITVAGNLNADTFNRFHRLATEPYGNNAEQLTQLSALPQLHYTGSNDTIVPPALTRSQLKEVSHASCIQITEIANATHHGPWQLNWSDFSTLQQACKH